jgi:hypothetical protein
MVDMIPAKRGDEVVRVVIVLYDQKRALVSCCWPFKKNFFNQGKLCLGLRITRVQLFYNYYDPFGVAHLHLDI